MKTQLRSAWRRYLKYRSIDKDIAAESLLLVITLLLQMVVMKWKGYFFHVQSQNRLFAARAAYKTLQENGYLQDENWVEPQVIVIPKRKPTELKLVNEGAK